MVIRLDRIRKVTMNIRRFFNSVVPALVFASLVATPVQAQDDAEPDTVEHEMIIISHPEEDGTLTVDEKISMLNEKLNRDPADAKSWNDLGVLYATQEKYDVARDAFIRAIQADHTNGDFHRNLGVAFSKLGMHEMAVSEFDAYRKFDAMGGRDYWRLIGGAQVQAGMIDDARATFTEGITAMEPGLGPEGFRLVLALNQLEVEKGNEEAVRALLEKYTPPAVDFVSATETLENPEGEDGYFEAKSIVHNRVQQMVDDGKLMEQSGLDAEAAKLYQSAYEMAPDRDDLLPRLVDVYIKQDMVLEAGVAARLARADHPEKAGTWIATGKVHEQNRKLEEAVAAYEKAYGIEEIDDLRVAIGNLYMRLGNDQEASKWLKAGLGNGAKPEVVYNYAVSLMREKKYHAAIPSLRTVTRDLPEMFQGWLALAQCYQMTKQYSKAIEPYEKALELNPDAKLAFHLGRVSMKSKQYDKSIAAYGTALEMDPTYVKARYNLSLTYMDAGRYEEAVESFDKMIELDGESYRAYYSQGLSYYYLGRYDEALEAFDMAMEFEETVNLFNNIGLVYDKLGDKKQTAEWYKKAQALKDGK
jgi:tetratricopeptide (TPR) repeat protein